MSGGRMNYIYSRLQSDAQFRLDTAERRAFMTHLEKVIKALHDIEWVDSGDYGRGDENAAIEACLLPGATLMEAIAEAKRVLAELATQIDRAQSSQSQPIK